MALVYCTTCATEMSDQAVACPKCGHPNAAVANAYRVGSGPVKSRIVAGVLALLLGGIGVHKFYLGQAGLGILYLLFFWTAIPAVIGVIEGIIYLVQSDAEFASKNKVTAQA